MIRNTMAYRRWCYAKRRRGKSIGILIKVASIFIILGLLVSYSENRIKPYLYQVSESKARDIIESAINSVVYNGFEESIKYDELVTVGRNAEGNITTLQTNVAKMNRIASRVSMNIRSRLVSLEKDYITVPIGVLTGTSIFAGVGPDLNIRIKPYGNVHTDFKSEFFTMDDNKTRHRIYLETRTIVVVAVPLLEERYELTTRVPVAETIIMGRLPGNFPGNETGRQQ